MRALRAYIDNRVIAPMATDDEIQASDEAAERDGGVGVIMVLVEQIDAMTRKRTIVDVGHPDYNRATPCFVELT